MKSICTILILLLLGLPAIAQQGFEMIFGEPQVGEWVVHTLEHQDYYYSLGQRSISPDTHVSKPIIYKINMDGVIIQHVTFPKPDTSYGIQFGIPKSNGNLLCFGLLAHESSPFHARHTYVCEISPNLELIWEKTDTILEPQPQTRHWLRNFLITPGNEVIIQGVLDTAMYGNTKFIFLAKYDFEGNRLDYRSFYNCTDFDEGSLMLNADSTGFYLFGELEVKPIFRTWIEFDLELNYLGSGVLPTNNTPSWAPVTAKRLSNGNFVTANRFTETGTLKKGVEMRLYNTDLELLKSTLVYHDKKVFIPVRRGLGFIDDNNIWVATFEDIPTGFVGTEDIRFFVFDNEVNLKGSKVHEGDTRYWLFDLLATSDSGCLVSGIVAEYEGTSINDNYIKKVRLEDVLTGIHEQERKTGRTVEIWPVPAGDDLHIKSNQDSDLLIFNVAGEQIRDHNIKEGYNIITLKLLAPGMYLIAIRQNGIIIESHKIIKQ
jgi:hypothetical protein